MVLEKHNVAPLIKSYKVKEGNQALHGSRALYT